MFSRYLIFDAYIYKYENSSPIQFSMSYCRLLRGCRNTEVFNKYINRLYGKDNDILLRGISTAIWNDARLVSFLYEYYSEEVRALIWCCNKNINKLRNHDEKMSLDEYCRNVRDYFELMLGFLKLRGYENFLASFRTGTRNSIELAMIVREIDYYIYTNNYMEYFCSIARCRFSEYDKPKELYAMSPLAYALNMYLTGDTGVGYIRVTGYSEDEADIRG